MNKRLEAEEVKKHMAKHPRFKSKCFVCGCKISKKGMTFHHLWYIFNDIIYSNYPRNDTGKLQYYQDLEKEVKKTPERFLFMCNTHHQAVERINRYGDKTLKKLLQARKMTQTNKKE